MTKVSICGHEPDLGWVDDSRSTSTHYLPLSKVIDFVLRYLPMLLQPSAWHRLIKYVKRSNVLADETGTTCH